MDPGLLQHLKALTTFLTNFQAAWDCSVVEIFTSPMWQVYPEAWLRALSRASDADLLRLPEGHVKDDWPPSLKDFVRTTNRLSLVRNPTAGRLQLFPGIPQFRHTLITSHTAEPAETRPPAETISTSQHTLPQAVPAKTTPPEQNLQSSHGLSNTPSQEEPPSEAVHCSAKVSRFSPPPGSSNSTPPVAVELDHVVAQGMSPKKRHEVAALASLVAKVAREAGATTVVDVGAGQGYLSNVLYYQYGLDVIAVDAAPGHAGVMQKRSSSISKYYRNLRRKARGDVRPDTCHSRNAPPRNGAAQENTCHSGNAPLPNGGAWEDTCHSRTAPPRNDMTSRHGAHSSELPNGARNQGQGLPVSLTVGAETERTCCDNGCTKAGDRNFRGIPFLGQGVTSEGQQVACAVTSGAEAAPIAAEAVMAAAVEVTLATSVTSATSGVTPPTRGAAYAPREVTSARSSVTSALEEDLWEGPIAVTSRIDFEGAAGFVEKFRAEVLKVKGFGREREIGRLLDGPVVLAGLHACGDLSANMLRTFTDCPSVKAVVVVSCCYNLVTEAASDAARKPEPVTLTRSEAVRISRDPEPATFTPFEAIQNLTPAAVTVSNTVLNVRKQDPVTVTPFATAPFSHPVTVTPSFATARSPEDCECPTADASEAVRCSLPWLVSPGSLEPAGSSKFNLEQPCDAPATRSGSGIPAPYGAASPPEPRDPVPSKQPGSSEACNGVDWGLSGLEDCLPGNGLPQRHGFALSVAVKATGFRGLGINGRMLACQSAARWQSQDELAYRDVILKHTLRAAFQVLLARHFPTVWAMKPVLGKQKKRPVGVTPGASGGNAAGRKVLGECGSGCVDERGCPNGKEVGQRVGKGQAVVKVNPAQTGVAGSLGGVQSGTGTSGTCLEAGQGLGKDQGLVKLNPAATENYGSLDSVQTGTRASGPGSEAGCTDVENTRLRSADEPVQERSNGTCAEIAVSSGASKGGGGVEPTGDETPVGPSAESVCERACFLEFARQSLKQLELRELSEEEIGAVWEFISPSKRLVGPFWTLRTSLAGPLESLLLLDRYLYLLESVESLSANFSRNETVATTSERQQPRIDMFPLFVPEVSPRNVVIVGQK